MHVEGQRQTDRAAQVLAIVDHPAQRVIQPPDRARAHEGADPGRGVEHLADRMLDVDAADRIVVAAEEVLAVLRADAARRKAAEHRPAGLIAVHDPRRRTALLGQRPALEAEHHQSIRAERNARLRRDPAVGKCMLVAEVPEILIEAERIGRRGKRRDGLVRMDGIAEPQIGAHHRSLFRADQGARVAVDILQRVAAVAEPALEPAEHRVDMGEIALDPGAAVPEALVVILGAQEGRIQPKVQATGRVAAVIGIGLEALRFRTKAHVDRAIGVREQVVALEEDRADDPVLAVIGDTEARPPRPQLLFLHIHDQRPAIRRDLRRGEHARVLQAGLDLAQIIGGIIGAGRDAARGLELIVGDHPGAVHRHGVEAARLGKRCDHRAGQQGGPAEQTNTSPLGFAVNVHRLCSSDLCRVFRAPRE
ncbi:hypothetical protein SDC9_12912 [bioreactor metagenome]|uniref:Uncharacterized protein n=1 Tax=bioreactor metagenome TaxID=1076179 RepID=A0A644TNC4_9ZZZZ